MKHPATGIHYDISADEYFALPYVSNSTLKSFAKNPHKWKHSPEFKPTASMKHGSLVDCLLLTPNDYDKTYVVSEFNAYRTKESKEWKSEQEESGLIVLTADEFLQAVAAVKALKKNPQTSTMLYESRRQAVVIFDATDSEGRTVRAKAMLDLVPQTSNVLADLKTAQDASPDGFSKAILNFGYAHQAAWYIDGYNAASDIRSNDGWHERDGFNFIVSENKAPYEVATYRLDLEAIEYGRRQYMKNLTLWNDCHESDQWPGYTDCWQTIELPNWAYSQEEN